MSQSTSQDRDLIAELVSRIKRADEARYTYAPQPQPAPAVEDKAWVQENQLPTEFFDYFQIERVA